MVAEDFALRDFRVAGGEDGVPEEAHLFLQRRVGGDHLVEPVGGGVLLPHHAGLLVMVAADEVVGHRGV